MKHLEPSSKYLIKLRSSLTIIALLVLACGAVIAVPISFDRSTDANVPWIVIGVTAGLDALWWIPAMLLSGPYYKSLSYEIRDEGIVMHVGIWTRSVKNVPYRTVTNITVKQDILDRWLGIGTLDIQTAGMSGTGGAEQSLVGLEQAQDIYEQVSAALRRFRGSMSPTAVKEEEKAAGATPDNDTLNAILTELEAIRRILEKD